MNDAARRPDKKHLEALARAVPVTRMVDYGVPLGDALQVHEACSADDPAPWDDACERIAERHRLLALQAQTRGRVATAALAWRAASALLQCAQLAYHHDGPRKRALYEAAHAAMAHHAALRGRLLAQRLPTPLGDLTAWVLEPAGATPQAAVVLLGGLSGWGLSYLDMAQALADRGMLAILAEGPGQGLPRLRGGLHLDDRSSPLWRRFVDLACAQGANRIGAWGNSFGGLFAAHLAVHDERVQAVCINGAPMVPVVPGFRTAREQMEAVFGTVDEPVLAARLAGLALHPGRHRTRAAVLVVEGGRDPLVPLGAQDEFFGLSSSTTRDRLSWPEGEHTVYNHAAERNARVSDWFAEQLAVRTA